MKTRKMDFRFFKLPTYFLIVSMFLLGGCASNKNFVNSGCEAITKYPEYRSDPATSRLSTKTVDLRELPCFWFSVDKEDTQYNETLISQAFAVESFVYSIAAFDVYEKSATEKESIPFPSSEDWSTIVLVQDIPSTGFYAKSYIRKTKNRNKELVISFRGTSGDIEDWTRGNLFFTNLFFLENQFDNSLAFTDKSIEIAGQSGGYDSIVFVGHSLGGGLAQYVQRYYKESRAIVFDSSPKRGRIYSIFDKKYPIDSLRVYERGEVLDYLRKPLDFDAGYDEKPVGLGKKTRWMSFYSGGPVSQHDMQDFAINLVKVAASTGNADALGIIESLEKDRTKEELVNPYYQLRNIKNIYRREIRERVLEYLDTKEANKSMQPTADAAAD
ncbi:hypothetical protein [Alteromonas sp. a30]|uniref:hypothetical protein n=1 Tax=Alteromonas sp. a30 TaxID=2730917 RepID=UPI00227EEF78|nr:hypothetical protein [Alteromonas sp. a30]MCY7297441.1 hypothetical protein [Alteromonas sp. a30]